MKRRTRMYGAWDPRLAGGLIGAGAGAGIGELVTTELRKEERTLLKELF